MLKKIFSNELGRGAIVLFITINIFNFLNFLFQFLMGRILGPADYGILAVLISITYIYNVPVEAIQNITSSYTSELNVKKEYGKMKTLLIKGLKKAFRFGAVIFILSVIVSIFLAKFLRINFWLIVLTNIIIFHAFLIPVTRGVLQGRKQFGFLGNSMIAESFFKLVFSLLFVGLGWQVWGAMGGILVGVFAGIFLSIYFNKDILKKKAEKISFKGVYPRSIPYFVVMIVIFAALSIDILLAKRFFTAELAGKYAVLSMIGKVVFFATSAIGKAMFSLTCEKCDDRKEADKLFVKSMAILLGICFVAIVVFLICPELIVKVLYGSQYIEIAPLLVYSGIALSFLSLSNLALIYGLSQNAVKYSGFLFLFLVIEVVLLYLFNSSVSEYILAFMFSNIIMFIGSLFFLKR